MTGPGDLFGGLPYEYASVVAPGSILLTAGACPLDRDGHVVAPGDIAAQAATALTNLEAILRHHGAGAEHIVRTTIYVVGARADLVTAWNVISGGLEPHRPPSTLLGVTVLGYEHQLVEIDAVARRSRAVGLDGRESDRQSMSVAFLIVVVLAASAQLVVIWAVAASLVLVTT